MTVTIKVLQDRGPESPRKWSNLSIMACWHKRYNLGDVQPKVSPEEWLKENAPKGSIVLPLYLMDHSGISMSTGSFGDPWDSGQVGYIVTTPEMIRKTFGVKRISKAIREKAEGYLKAEVTAYDDFLTGNVWGYTISVTHDCSECGAKVNEEEFEDSCWGFFGESLDAMKEHVDQKYHEALERAWEDRG